MRADGWDVGAPVLVVNRVVDEGWWVDLGVPVLGCVWIVGEG